MLVQYQGTLISVQGMNISLLFAVSKNKRHATNALLLIVVLFISNCSPIEGLFQAYVLTPAQVS